MTLIEELKDIKGEHPQIVGPELLGRVIEALEEKEKLRDLLVESQSYLHKDFFTRRSDYHDFQRRIRNALEAK